MTQKIIKIEQAIQPLKRAKLTEVSLEIQFDLPFEEWEKIGEALRRFRRANLWWLGDWINWGENKYGEMYSQALDETGYDYKTLAHLKQTANKVEIDRRRSNLSFSHHTEVKGFEPKEQEKWLKKAEKEGWDRDEFRRQIRDANKENVPLPEGKFNIIYADPPWTYKNIGVEGAVDKEYSTMTIRELCSLPIKKLVPENAVLFLWVTNPLIEECFEVIESWGFSYKTNFCWLKRNRRTGIGFYVRGIHELLLICVKGQMLPKYTPLSIIEADAKEHSRKPEVYDLIEKMYPNQKYIELFARNKKKRLNWSYWGDQANI